MKDKLLVCDLDGTLLDEKGQIDQESLRWIKQFCQDGGRFVICTGRMDTDIKYVEKQLGFESDYRISQNGAVVYDRKNQLVACETIPSSYIPKLNEAIFGMGLRTEVSNAKNRLFPSPRDPENVAEFVDSSIIIEDLPTFVGETEKNPTIYLTFGDRETFDVIRQQIEARLGMGKVNIVMTSPSSLEVFSNKVSKGAALKDVMVRLAVAPENTYVAGDAESDVTMFTVADHSYAVQKAPAEIRAQAKDYAKNVGEIVEKLYHESSGQPA